MNTYCDDLARLTARADRMKRRIYWRGVRHCIGAIAIVAFFAYYFYVGGGQ